MTDNTPDARRIIGDFKAADAPKTVTEEQIAKLTVCIEDNMPWQGEGPA